MIISFLPKGRIRPQTIRGNHRANHPSPTDSISPLNQRLNADQFTPRAAVAKPHFAGVLTVKHPNQVMDKKGNTWLHYAVAAGDFDLLQRLLKWEGANLGIENHQGMNPYTFCATVSDHPNTLNILRIAEAIKDAGGKLQAFPPDSMDNYKTDKPFIHPSDIAKVHGTEKIRDFFLKEEEIVLKRIGYIAVSDHFKTK